MSAELMVYPAYQVASTEDELRIADREAYDGPEGLSGAGWAAAADEGALGWQERALCAQTDPEAFFPEKGGSTREAKRVCLTCDVRGDCLEYALMNDERFGIWGGLSERERRKLKKHAV
jgi:WhiB family transcriptional regulator, redox-sensing transcriptional regulator